jgi:hypothetical protein
MVGGQRPATDATVKLNHVLPSQARMHPEETKVHRRGPKEPGLVNR